MAANTHSPSPSVSPTRARAGWLVPILAVYALLSWLYAVYTPAWQVPDEPAHYNYVQALASGQLPVMEMGDYDQAYINRLVFESRFAPQLSIEPLRYQDWQPPLYYALAVPLFLLTNGSLLALRLFSAVLGAGVVVLAFLIVRQAFPARPALAVGTAAFVAFVPQHVAMLAGVNNDSLAELLLAGVMWGIVRSTSQGQPAALRRWAWAGVLIGLGLVTKLSFYFVVLLAAWAMLRQVPAQPAAAGHRLTARPKRWLGLVAASLPAACIALPWWVRNAAVYGWPDILGQARHNAVVVGQPTSAWWIEQYGWGNLIERFFTFTFQSFWGQFGWMTVPLPPRYYLVLGGLSLLALAGCAWAGLPRLGAIVRDARFQLLGGWLVLVALTYLYYNLTFVQHQGRYLFPALIPIGLAFTAGLWQWVRWLPGAWRSAALALPYLGLVGLDLLALFRIVVPALS